MITTEAELRAVIGEPAPLTVSKIVNRVNALTRQFIERAPFLCLSTSDANGHCDVSPRGDPPGFVKVLDERTLLIPERPGNRIADSLRNILQNPHVGVLFIIPGVGETFRVNGRARLITDQSLLAPCAVEGKVPKLGIIVEIDEAYTQCPKAFIRSDFWNHHAHQTRESLPSSGEIHASFTDEAFDAEAHDRERAERYTKRLGFY